MTLISKGNSIDSREVRRNLNNAGLVPKKSLGQNFLVDSEIATRIANSFVVPGLKIFEIGPGLGSLTGYLAIFYKQVIALEKDEAVAATLQKDLKARHISNVNVIVGDALKFDFESYAKEHLIQSIIGNLPYNISVPLILTLVEDAISFKDMVFLVQTEVAHRLCALPGSRNSSFTSLKMRLFTDPELLFDVPNMAFHPVPKVSSTLIRVTRTNRWIDAYGLSVLDATLRLAKSAFRQRRQMLRRTLCAPELRKAMSVVDVDETDRPENLNLQAWLTLGKEILDSKINLDQFRQ